MPPIEQIVTLRKSHIASVMRLNQAAGWNQTEQDWDRVVSLEPDGCLAVETDGAIVSTTTAVCYGRRLAWIGMVLTDSEYRGRGYARRLMERALEFLDKRGVERTKLDATDMGRPLYVKLGFEDETLVERWVLPVVPALVSGVGDVAPFEFDVALDLEAFGADRSALIRSLPLDDAASVLGDGYAMGRPGTRYAYFGPCVTRTPDGARKLLQRYLSRHPGESVAWDILADNKEAIRLAQEFGFERRRQLVRQMRPGPRAAQPFVHNDSYVYAIAGFECG
jgi:GNAT superfamily N-acetyltransferase